MPLPEEHEYTPINLDEDRTRPLPKRRLSTWRIVLYVELFHILLFSIVYLLWHLQLYPRSPLDNLHLPLSANITRTFTVDKSDLHLVLDTDAANYYWLNITRDLRNGLVSLPNTLTNPLGLAPSTQKTAEGESVYQLDVFHQLHCLQRIRSDILASPYLSILNPNRTSSDPYTRHTLHCIDYLRQAVMCNSDVTLVSTGADLEFDHSPPRQCRDFDAVGEWVLGRKWEYEKYTGMVNLGGKFGGRGGG
ncbi:hypothetical protein EJ08DRAFT_218989 [Tothia fuscella]|uniref:Uncharacterized protein n=1 Tax=Tothia fuscella TaxID=1048955 RepID=A0A9P4NS89_9PEZI|nr:hypothetical protein EJ08DRAFT_218989 [Tothia fuscella]